MRDQSRFSESLLLQGREADKFDLWPRSRQEGDLVEMQFTAPRVGEAPFASFATEDILLAPMGGEKGAFLNETIDQRAHRGVVRVAVEVGPEFRHETPGPVSPIA